MAILPHTSDESGFPAYWDWAVDGVAAGTFVRMSEGPTAFGQKPIMVLDIAGVERSVWVNAESLKAKLGDELLRRKARDFSRGERVEIRRGAEKKTSASDREYWPFAVLFPDAPRSDAAGLLGVDENTEPTDSSADDDTPPF